MDMPLRIKKNEIILEAEDESEENTYFNDNESQNINLPEKMKKIFQYYSVIYSKKKKNM